MTPAPRHPPDPRRRDLALIHIAAKAAGLDDADYRTLLREVAGVDSARDLDAAGRRAVLARLRPGGAEVRSIRDWRTPRIAKIRRLWGLLAEAGVLRQPGEAAMRRFCARQTGVARLEWASGEALNRCIEALKSWAAREHVEVQP